MDTSSAWDWSSIGGEFAQSSAQSAREPPPEPSHTQPREARNPSTGQQYGPRTCRICFDTEQPKFPNEPTSIFGVRPTSKPTYVSDDPDLGRLLSPCKCKGSQKYVHEGCLNAWRLSNPTETRNYWQCPTCKFTYRISRLHWASALSSKWAQIALTLVILVLSIFTLGFIADPIFDLWNDPVGKISDTVTSVVTDIEAMKPPPYQEPTTWGEHFIKGFFSLGIVGIFKAMLAMSPWQWWNLRNSGVVNTGGRRQGTGRARVENISYVFVLIGALTFLMGIWRAVKSLSAVVLRNVSDRVLDVDEEDDAGDGAAPESDTARKTD